jgi:carboxyl-terminal processing protease
MHNRTFQIAATALFVLTVWFGGSSAQTPCATVWPTDYLPAPTGTTLDVERRQSLFKSIWETVGQHHLNATQNASIWTQAQTEFAARAMAAKDDAGFYAVLQEMIQSLGDRSSIYLPPWELQFREGISNEKRYGIGVAAVPNPEGMLVTHVLEGSDAALLGLHRRDLIVQVNGEACPTPQSLVSAANVTVNLNVRKPDGSNVTLKVGHRGRADSKWFSMTRLEDRPGVVLLTLPSFYGFSNEVSFRLSEMLAVAPIEGVIVDVRSNAGGPIDEGFRLAGQFIGGNLIELRPSKSRLDARPGLLLPRLKDTPLLILVDAQSKNTSELFAASLQARKRARVIGVRTPGEATIQQSFEYGDGSRLYLATQEAYLPDGTRIAEHGVTPDVILEPDWFRYSEKDDPYIRRALEELQR